MKPKINKIAKSDQKSHTSKTSKKLVKKITTTKNWDDLVIDKTTKQQLNNISTWIRNVNIPDNNTERNKDVKHDHKVLFFGSRRTGKKLAAKLLGKQGNLDVYRIDLSKLISKYIGETEKNLAKIFDAAETKNWILFFDEADALFGKRTDVSDAHDKYKAAGISCLVQQVEAYPGLVIFSSKKYKDSNNIFTKDLNDVIHFKKLS